jgi:hypothetical protein
MSSQFQSKLVFGSANNVSTLRVAEDQARWRAIGETYVQQWTVVG